MRARVVVSVLVLVLGLLAGACSSGGSDSAGEAVGSGTAANRADVGASDTGTSAAAPTTAAHKPAVYDAAPCPMPIPATVTNKVDCGYLAVPENRLDPNSRTIKLAVARIHSSNPNPKPDPVVQLEGGPGYPSLSNVEGYAKSSVLGERDLIIWDQRGIGYSTPNLNCPETDEAVWQMFATTDPAEAEGKRLDTSLAACRDRLKASGVDLNGYNTTQNAADLADMRKAMGIEEWNLRGVSYGSALAIETVRNNPEGIHSVLLDSVVPPDSAGGAIDRGESGMRSFDELYKACAADTTCKTKYGDLEALVKKAADSLDANPYEVTVTDPDTGQPRTVNITGQDLYAGLFNAMYDETLIPVLPAAIQAIANGDRSIIDQLATTAIPFVTSQTEAMTASVDCADRERLLKSPAEFEAYAKAHPELGALLYVATPETGCKPWGVKQLPPSFNQLLTKTDVPILVMAGRFDPITPPAGTKRVADALGLKVLMFPNAGHGAVGSSDCARGIYLAFMDDPSKTPDTSCMADLKPPAFS